MEESVLSMSGLGSLFKGPIWITGGLHRAIPMKNCSDGNSPGRQ